MCRLKPKLIDNHSTLCLQEMNMKTFNLRALVSAAILGATALAVAGASAADPSSGVRSVTIKYGDLNLSNTEGAKTLYGRIARASHEVCDTADDRFPEVLLAEHSCRAKAIADAVTKVGHPNLIAVYNANNRTPLPIRMALAR
jgi:UrcA family protein